MTDLSQVESVARTLTLSESTVDTPETVASLSALKETMLSASDGNQQVDFWLSEEHMAGGVLSTAATMNKRAELSGKGNPFNVQSRSTLIRRYNEWAQQLAHRVSEYERGRGDVANYVAQLALFHADPVRNEP